MFVAPRNETADFEALLALRNEAEGFKYWSVFSNFFILAAAATAGAYREGTATILTLFAFLISVGYHTCIEFDECMGISPQYWQRSDHLTASLIIVAIFHLYIVLHDLDVKPWQVLIAEADERGEDSVEGETLARLLQQDSLDLAVLDPDEGDLGGSYTPPLFQLHFANIWGFLVVIPAALVVFYWPPSDVTPIYLVVIFCCMGMIFYFGALRIERSASIGAAGFMIMPFGVHIPYLILAIIFGAAGIGCFLAPNDSTSLFHSFWHVFAGLAPIFLVLAKELRPLEPLYRVQLVELDEEEEKASAEAMAEKRTPILRAEIYHEADVPGDLMEAAEGFTEEELDAVLLLSESIALERESRS